MNPDPSPASPSPAPSSARIPWPTLLLPILVFLLSFALFAPSIAYSLVDYDDTLFIVNNSLIREGLTLPACLSAFSPSLHGDASMYSPLLWISWMSDVSLFGATPAHPWPFHLGNVFLHALNALLLYFLLRRCRATPLAAALLALLWACHPLRVESVAWVTERKDTLSTFFAFLSILAYLKAFPRTRGSGAEPPPPTCHSSLVTCHCHKGRLCLALASFAAGLLVKPMLVTLPFLFLLFDAFPLRRIALDRSFSFKAVLRLILEKIPFFILAAAASAVSLRTQSGAIQHDFPFFSRLAVVPLHYAFYLIKTFIPLHLTPFYYSISFSWDAFIPFALFFAALFISAWRRRTTHPAWSLGILAFFGLFVPVVGFLHVGIHHIADRYTYLPAIGLSIAAVPLLSSPSRLVRIPFLVLAALALAAVSAITLHILPTWSSTEAFFARAARYAPDHPFVVVDQAKRLIAIDADYARAEELLDRALATPSRSPDAYLCKALCVDERLGPRAALDALLELPLQEFNTGCCYEAAQYALRSGLWEAARRFSCVGRSRVAPSSYYVGDFLELDFATACLSDDTENLAAVVRQAAGIHPDPVRRAFFQTHSDFSPPDLMPYYQIQWAHLHRSDAWRYFQSLVPLAGDDPRNLRTIAGLFASAEGWSPAPPDEILAIARRAAELAPDDPVILDTYAAAQANAGDFPSAVGTASRALSLAPPGSPLAADIATHLASFQSGKSLRK